MKGKKLYLLSLMILVFIGINAAFTTSSNLGEDVAIIYNQKNATYAFIASEMKKNIEKTGHKVMLADVNSLGTLKAQNRIILTMRGTPEAGNLSLPASVSQGYSVRKKANGSSTDWYIIGFDKRGAINGGFDVSESIKYNGLTSLAESDKKPYITNRGIKFNIPLDARTPSYNDNSDAAQQNIADMWDINFWHEFLDEMARDRYNMLSLWNESPFPTLVEVPEYPKASLSDIKKTTARLMPTTDGIYMSTPGTLAKLVTIKKMTIAEKIKFWQDVMSYANDRGIDCYLFTWNLFVYGTEDSGYGLTDQMTNPTTKDYIRKATRTLIKTYPLLKGMGLTAGENLRGTEPDKEKFLYEAYALGINDALDADPSRTFGLIHRAHQADIKMIKATFTGLNPRCEMTFSYKYSVAQMYSSETPKYIYESKFLDDIGDSKFFLTVRDDAWYNLRGGSDPKFARNYIKGMPMKNFQGFYMGPDGFTWGKDYLDKTSGAQHQLIIKKRWYCMQLMGKLAYDPDLTDAYFAKSLKDKFPEADAAKLQEAWAKASEGITWVNKFHNVNAQNDFQWYPEASTSFYGFHTIDKFISFGPQTQEGILGIPAYAEAVLNNKPVNGTSPLQLAQTLQSLSDRSLSLIAGMNNVKDRELKQTVSDIKAMSYLNQYYSKKIEGATNKQLSDKSTDAVKKTEYLNAAIKNLEDASSIWKLYAAQVSNTYLPQTLSRLHLVVDFQALQADVDKEVSQLKNALPAPSGQLRAGQQLEVSFSNAANYFYWHPDKINLTVNWSPNKYFVMDVYATTAQKFDFELKTDQEETIVRKDIQPVAGKWTKIAIPLDYFKKELAKMHNTPGGDISGLLNNVRTIALHIEKPVGYPVVQIRALNLIKEDPGNDTVVLN